MKARSTALASPPAGNGSVQEAMMAQLRYLLDNYLVDLGAS